MEVEVENKENEHNKESVKIEDHAANIGVNLNNFIVANRFKEIGKFFYSNFI